MDYFVKDRADYKRTYNLQATYLRDMAKALSLARDIPYDQAFNFLQQQTLPGGKLEFKMPRCRVLERNEFGDRQMVVKPFIQFLYDVAANNEILVPSMTSYLSPRVRESLLAQFIDGNLKRRSAAKKEKFIAEMNKDYTLAANKESEQQSLKTNNNSLSGAHSSQGTPLHNKSSHSALTSTCRAATSYGNGNNEKFLMGNRHYWCSDIVKYNIASIVNRTDLAKLDDLIAKYDLRYPTIDEVMGCIERGSLNYWRSPTEMDLLRRMVTNLTDVERAAFLYIGDFYHFAMCNGDFARQFLTVLSKRPSETLPLDEADHWMKQMDADMLAYVSIICVPELGGAGRSLNNCDGKETKLRDGNPEGYGRFAAKVKEAWSAMNGYRDIVQMLMVSDSLPASIFMMGSVVRRAVVTSDTDSTIFSLQFWRDWQLKENKHSDRSAAVTASLGYLAGQLIRHTLATVSGNMGVDSRDIFKLSMKNEYMFPVFALTSRAKHYYAYMSAQEGNVFEQMKTEIKGVALRSAKVPADIMKKSQAFNREIMDRVLAGEKVSVVEIMRKVAAIENTIKKDVLSGGYSLMGRVSIKDEKAYTNPGSSNFVHYGLWDEVFGPKYGYTTPPPYGTVKMSLDVNSPSKMREWLDALEDKALAERMRKWLARVGRDKMTMILVPEVIAAEKGIPPEIIAAVDIRGMITQNMESFYLTLESMGLFIRNERMSRLVSDRDWGEVEDAVILSDSTEVEVVAEEADDEESEDIDESAA